jgi:hypothetical protein
MRLLRGSGPASRCEGLRESSDSHNACIFGSAQEFVETRILGCFLKNDEFGLGDRHALRLEQEIGEVLVATAPSKKGFDVAVDGFYHPEAYFRAGVVQDSIQVIQ